MDAIMLAILNSLKKSGGVGHTESAKTVVLAETELSNFNAMGDGLYVTGGETSWRIIAGNLYTVVYDGDSYLCRAYTNSESPDTVCLGNLAVMNAVGASYEDTGEPFLYQGDSSEWAIFVNTEGTHTLSISTITETIHPIAPKYIPPLDSLTLNGADGKQYKLSVDESGQLVTAAIE